jgi:5S rRNA maturation endonuclease (ribonuclease M5)
MKTNIVFVENVISFFSHYSFNQQDRLKLYVKYFDLKLDKNNNLKPLNKSQISLFNSFIHDINSNMLHNNNGLELLQLTKFNIFTGLTTNKEIAIILNLLNEFKKYFQDEKISSIKSYALNHSTHNAKTLKIRPKNHYFQYKDNLQGNIKTLVLNDNMDLNMLNNMNVIIIENQYIFEQTEKEFLYYFRKFNFKYKNEIIIFGSGNKSSSLLLQTYLNTAKNIYCFYDLDNNGYKMYEILKKGVTSNTPVEFMIPYAEVIISIQTQIKENYNSSPVSKRETFTTINDKSKLFDKILNKLDNKIIIPIYSMYEESFISF